MNLDKWAAYREELDEMTSGFPGWRSSTVRRYLESLEKMYGPAFDPIKALDELVQVIDMLTTQLAKRGIQ